MRHTMREADLNRRYVAKHRDKGRRFEKMRWRVDGGKCVVKAIINDFLING